MTVPPPPAFSINVEPTQTKTRIDVAGELDIATAPKLVRELERSANDTCNIDVGLEQVTFIDVVAVTHLLRAQQRLRVAGVRVALTHLSDQVTRTLALTGLQDAAPLQPPVRRARDLVGPAHERRPARCGVVALKRDSRNQPDNGCG